MSVDRTEFGITERNIIDTIERVTATTGTTGRYVRAYVGGEWIDVVHAARGGNTVTWELTTPGEATLLVPTSAVVFRFEASA